MSRIRAPAPAPDERFWGGFMNKCRLAWWGSSLGGAGRGVGRDGAHGGVAHGGAGRGAGASCACGGRRRPVVGAHGLAAWGGAVQLRGLANRVGRSQSMASGSAQLSSFHTWKNPPQCLQLRWPSTSTSTLARGGTGAVHGRPRLAWPACMVGRTGRAGRRGGAMLASSWIWPTIMVAQPRAVNSNRTPREPVPGPRFRGAS